MWESILVFLILISFISFVLNTHNLVSLLLNSEFLIIMLFCLFTNTAVLFNVNIAIGVSLSFLILGGLEIALTLMLLII